MKALRIKGLVKPEELALIAGKMTCCNCGGPPPPAVVVIDKAPKGEKLSHPVIMSMVLEGHPPPAAMVFGFCEPCGREKGLIKETGEQSVGG
jgi:hypothetical protein